MIYLYYGKIGDGKTYHVVANELLPAVRAGRKVYTNIDGLNRKHIAMLTGRLENELDIVHVEHPDIIRDLLQVDVNDKEGNSLKIEKSSLVIIDEAQTIWDAREFRDTKKSFLTFLEYHRHYGLDLVFITQNPKRLESSIVRLANESYQVKNLKILGSFLKNRYVLHIRQTPNDREVIATIRGKYRHEIFSCYRSYVASSKKFSKKTKGAMQGFLYYSIAVFLVLAVAIFIIKGGFSFTKDPARSVSVKATNSGINNTNFKGVQNVSNTNIKTLDFIYPDSSSQKLMEISEKQIQTNINKINECEKYKFIKGKNYIRRGNEVLIKGKDNVWRNIYINCDNNTDNEKNAVGGSGFSPQPTAS